MIEPAEILDESQRFEDEQLSGIGATDSPKLLGLSRYGTALTVYRRLTGETTPSKPSLPAWLGLKMENTVAELYTGATGNRTRRDDLHHKHPTQPYVVCHLDRRVLGDPKTLVEIKTRSRMAGWGAEGSADIPTETFVQVQHEMAVVSATACHVAVLFGHHTYRTYVLPRDDEFIASLLEALREFWEEHFLPRIPPLPTGNPIDSDDVRARAGETGNGQLLPATAELEALAARLRMARQNMMQANTAHEEVKNRLIQEIGENDGLTGAFGTIWYRRASDSTYIAWDLIAKAYAGLINQLLAEIAERSGGPLWATKAQEVKANVETLRGLYTSTRPGVRRFIPVFTEE